MTFLRPKIAFLNFSFTALFSVLSLLTLFTPSLSQAQLKSLDSQIVVVGGGPSGLSTAHYLRKAGYRNVVVLEKQSEVGGKTYTTEYKGRNYEMGAIMSGPSYEEVIAIAKEFNQEIVGFSEGAEEMREYDPKKSELATMSLQKKLSYLAAALEYQMVYRKFEKFLSPAGMKLAPAELNQNFSAWADKNFRYSKTLQELLSHSFVSFGYGYLSEVPALYVMKYFSPPLLRSFIFGQIHMVKNGYQELWKTVASSLNVETKFEVVSALRDSSNKWTVTAADGRQVNADIIIYAGQLDVAAKTVQMPEHLRKVLSQINYQHYFSTLVEIDGLPRGSGVVPSNYQARHQGGIVSWLHRWPEQSQVANFYTLSDVEMAPEQVEQQIRDFAKQNGFEVKSVIKNVGWKYFPHFKQEALDAGAYTSIESLQGREGLYFAGEIMNFSTVEHSVEYARNLVEKFFTDSTTLSVKLPKDYNTMSTQEKLSTLWRQILNSEYRKLPTYQEVSGSAWKNILGFFPAKLAKAFSNNSDVIEKDRMKIIHKLGSVALFDFRAANPDYQNFSGLIRLSNAVDAKDGVVYPSFSIKIPQPAGEASINFNIGKSFDGQRQNNQLDGKPDFNFFRDDAKYPFSNELPLEPRSSFGKVFKWIFDRAHFQPNYIPIDELSKLMKKQAPRRLIFRASHEVQQMMDSNHYQDEREVFAKIPAGKVLFHVFESTGLNDKGTYVGDIVNTTRFVASKFGDMNLYFRHENKGVKSKASPSELRKPRTDSEDRPPSDRDLDKTKGQKADSAVGASCSRALL